MSEKNYRFNGTNTVQSMTEKVWNILGGEASGWTLDEEVEKVSEEVKSDNAKVVKITAKKAGESKPKKSKEGEPNDAVEKIEVEVETKENVLNPEDV